MERSVEQALRGIELINRVELAPEKKEVSPGPERALEPFEYRGMEDVIDHIAVSADEGKKGTAFDKGFFVETGEPDPVFMEEAEPVKKAEPEPVQEELFSEKMIQPSNRPDFNIIGCVFNTYWIIEYKDRMLLVDQHAAHEKVMYEKFVNAYKEKKVVSQYVEPPVIITLSGRQEETVERYGEAFSSLGFELERFEGRDFALRAVPSGFMKLNDKELFTGLLDELTEINDDTSDVSLIHDRLAEMSCKAAVKGGNRLSLMEADALLNELLSLENPYNCPHGRPTMVEFTERDLEKFFKRVV
ncbi:MAG: hypothetical protein IJT24_07095 [Lachnospiraceae bacterium]|nr:hypothetical protein [Lachnospiraceae bacterium]